MDDWTKCPHCGNRGAGSEIYKCSECDGVICEECRGGFFDGHDCPKCGESSNVSTIGEIPSEDTMLESTGKWLNCPNCDSNKSGSDILKCDECGGVICDECRGGFFSGHECPICDEGSSCNVLGEIE
jgi:hypothetical protein